METRIKIHLNFELPGDQILLICTGEWIQKIKQTLFISGCQSSI